MFLFFSSQNNNFIYFYISNSVINSICKMQENSLAMDLYLQLSYFFLSLSLSIHILLYCFIIPLFLFQTTKQRIIVFQDQPFLTGFLLQHLNSDTISNQLIYRTRQPAYVFPWVGQFTYAPDYLFFRPDSEIDSPQFRLKQ